jgi:hypothetical protein
MNCLLILAWIDIMLQEGNYTMLLFKAIKKALIMNRIERLYNKPLNIEEMISQVINREKSEINKAIEDLYKCMLSTPGYKEILQNHGTTSEELKKIYSRILLIIPRIGGAYQKMLFVPVALISYGKPLNFILDNKELILSNNSDVMKDVVKQAINLL